MVERDEKGGKKSKNPPQREINIHFTVDYIYINISPKPRPNKYISKCPGLCPGPGAPKYQAPALSPPLPYLRAGHFRAGKGRVGPGHRAWALPCTTLFIGIFFSFTQELSLFTNIKFLGFNGVVNIVVVV